jgi:hypothetical protein
MDMLADLLAWDMRDRGSGIVMRSVFNESLGPIDVPRRLEFKNA